MGRKRCKHVANHNHDLNIRISRISKHGRYLRRRRFSSVSFGIDPTATLKMSNLLKDLRINCSSKVKTSTLQTLIIMSLTTNRSHNRAHVRYACDIADCGETFTLQKDVRRHRQTRHADQTTPAYGCTDCDRGFHRKDHFMRHRRSHENGKIRVSKAKERISTKHQEGPKGGGQNGERAA